MRLAPTIALALLAACSDNPPSGNWAASNRNSPLPAGTLQATPQQAGHFDAAVLRAVNLARTAAGRAPLQPDPRLTRAARDHAANMASLGQHSHRVPVRGQARLTERMARQGIRYNVAGENIGMEKLYRLAGRPIALKAENCRFTYADTHQAVPPHDTNSLAEAAVARWMASPKHRASILRRDFRYTGSGFGIDPAGPACGDVYLAQTFSD